MAFTQCSYCMYIWSGSWPANQLYKNRVLNQIGKLRRRKSKTNFMMGCWASCPKSRISLPNWKSLHMVKIMPEFLRAPFALKFRAFTFELHVYIRCKPPWFNHPSQVCGSLGDQDVCCANCFRYLYRLQVGSGKHCADWRDSQLHANKKIKINWWLETRFLRIQVEAIFLWWSCGFDAPLDL